MTDLVEWAEAQRWEAGWWGSCVNTFGEEAKQITYAHRMGLENIGQSGGYWPVYDLAGRNVIDLGGGPVSILLKCVNPGGRCLVVDPAAYPGWVASRYTAAAIGYSRKRAEDTHLRPVRRVLALQRPPARHRPREDRRERPVARARRPPLRVDRSSRLPGPPPHAPAARPRRVARHDRDGGGHHRERHRGRPRLLRRRRMRRLVVTTYEDGKQVELDPAVTLSVVREALVREGWQTTSPSDALHQTFRRAGSLDVVLAIGETE